MPVNIEITLREGKNLVKFKSDAKHAGATTYRLRLSKFEKDTEKHNNEGDESVYAIGRCRKVGHGAVRDRGGGHATSLPRRAPKVRSLG
jgi:hypothetical protein